ncbi:MAG: hypothetical protein J7K87_03740 [Candidatus Aenigmarchaeota archaeon]|nr:hypothetical protein [Candidatus Aenigmarchaeota archaeon]
MAVFRGSSDAQLTDELIKRLNESTRRIRDLEEFNRTLETKIDSMEMRLIKRQSEIKTRFDEIEKSVKDLNIRLMKIENENEKIKKSLEKTATKLELEEIENFIKLMDPIKMNFVTRNEVERMIKESK